MCLKCMSLSTSCVMAVVPPRCKEFGREVAIQAADQWEGCYNHAPCANSTPDSRQSSSSKVVHHSTDITTMVSDAGLRERLLLSINHLPYPCSKTLPPRITKVRTARVLYSLSANFMLLLASVIIDPEQLAECGWNRRHIAVRWPIPSVKFSEGRHD